MDINSTRAEITRLQERLIELMWLEADGLTGSYDEATCLAIETLQLWLNDNWSSSQWGSVMPMVDGWHADEATMYVLSLLTAPMNPYPVY